MFAFPEQVFRSLCGGGQCSLGAHFSSSLVFVFVALCFLCSLIPVHCSLRYCQEREAAEKRGGSAAETARVMELAASGDDLMRPPHCHSVAAPVV